MYMFYEHVSWGMHACSCKERGVSTSDGCGCRATPASGAWLLRKYVHGFDELDFARYLGLAGYKLEQTREAGGDLVAGVRQGRSSWCVRSEEGRQEGLEADVSGIFMDAAGRQTAYTIDDLDFQLIQVVEGTLNQVSETITFPSEPFVGAGLASAHSIGGVPLGPWTDIVQIDQAVGSLRNGVLTVNLTLNLTGGVFTIAIETVP